MSNSNLSVKQQGKSKADNAALYEALGDEIITRAHTGDEYALRIFELALKKTRSDNDNGSR